MFSPLVLRFFGEGFFFHLLRELVQGQEPLLLQVCKSHLEIMCAIAIYS